MENDPCFGLPKDAQFARLRIRVIGVDLNGQIIVRVDEFDQEWKIRAVALRDLFADELGSKFAVQTQQASTGHQAVRDNGVSSGQG